LDTATDLRVIAEAIKVPVERLRELNPHLLRWITPPADPKFELIIPAGYGETFSVAMASIPADKRVMWAHHTVNRGETLSIIAQKYGTTVKDLAQANNLDVKKTIQVGQSLLIPIGGGLLPPVGASASTPGAGKTASSGSALTAPVRTVAKAANYTVKKGDSLSKIAAQFGVSVADLQRWNKLTSTALAVGKNLVVGDPAPPVQQASKATPNTRQVVHEVRAGETLGRIAQTYNTTVEAIRSWNGRNDLSVIHPGDRITIFLGN
jgi:membrane-bound lytic murein transglycosylase D